jgi:hypothetical protein
VDFLSLHVFSQRVLRNLTDVAKDGSGIVAYYHLGIFDKPGFFIDCTRRRGGMQAQSCGAIPVFNGGFGA